MVPNSLIEDLVPEKPNATFNNLYKGSGVFLINADNTCMDYPRIEAPHYHFIGGMAATPAKPVPQEFENFISKADKGINCCQFWNSI